MMRGRMPSSFILRISQDSEMLYLARTSAFDMSTEKSPLLGWGVRWLSALSCSIGMRTVREETFTGWSSPALMRAYRVGRETPRNLAASVMERWAFPSSVALASFTSALALRASLRWRLMRVFCVLRQATLQYVCLGMSVVNVLPQQEQVFVTMCILFTTFWRRWGGEPSSCRLTLLIGYKFVNLRKPM